MEIIFKRTHAKIKKPRYPGRNVFLLHSPRTVNIEPAATVRIDTEIIILLPNNSWGFVTSKFRGDEIYKFSSDKQRLWVEILNKSKEDALEIKKDSTLGLAVIEPEHLAHKYESKKKTKKNKILKTLKYRPKTKEASWRFV